MDKFFLGMLTGSAALVAPLLLSSLFLPGPEGTYLGVDRLLEGQSARQATSPDQPDADEVEEPQPSIVQTDDQRPADSDSERAWIRHVLAAQGFSVEFPEDWHILERRDLQDMKTFGGNAAIDTMILAVADSKDEDDLTGMAMFMDVGLARLDSLAFIESMEQQITDQLPNLRVKQKAKRTRFDQFDGATVVFETTPAARLIMSKVDQKYSVVEIGDRAVIMAMTSVPGTESEDIITRIEGSLRPN